MLDQCQHRHRRHAFRSSGGNRQQQGAGRRLAQGTPGAVVGLDPPATEQRRHPRGEHSIGRDQRGGLARRFDRLAKRDCDGHCLARRIGQFGGADPGQAAFAWGQAAPFVAEVGGGHGIGDRAAANRRRCRPSTTAPHRHFAARDPDAVEQQLQMILGMAFLGTPVLIRAERVPFLVVHDLRQRERGKHDCSVRHSRHAAQQRGDRRRGGGDPRGDGEPRRRRARPTLGGGAQQKVAPISEVDHAASRKLGGPGTDDRLQPVERHLPMSGEFWRFGCRLGQLRRRHFLDSQRIERPCQIGGKAHRFGRALIPTSHNACQCQLARQRIDCARHPRTIVGGVERATNSIVELGIADRDQSRQDESAAAGPHKRLGQCPHRAIVGQQDSAHGQRHRIATVAQDQPGGERVGEAAVRRDREDGRSPQFTFGARAVTHSPAPPRYPGSSAACPRRTTALGGPVRSSDQPRSLGPTIYWSRKLPPVHHRASAWR